MKNIVSAFKFHQETSFYFSENLSSIQFNPSSLITISKIPRSHFRPKITQQLNSILSCEIRFDKKKRPVLFFCVPFTSRLDLVLWSQTDKSIIS